MYMVILGVLLLLMKIAAVGPVANWSWFVVLAPFALAVAWWAWADSSGWTKRREIEKMEDKKKARRARSMSALGLDPQKEVRAAANRAGYREVQASKIEDKRDAIRRKNRETLARSTRPAGLGNSRPGDLDSRL
jgi:small Trp-rich protein